MLDFLRRGVKTWVAKVLLATLVASFAVFGIGDVFSGSTVRSVATVGDQSISAQRFSGALNAEIRTQSQRFGQPIDAQMARALGLEQQVLARMAQEATLDQAVANLALSAPDEAVSRVITSDRTFFDASGAFDSETYRYRLAQANFSIEDYEAETRKSLTRAALAQALSIGAAAPEGAIDTIYKYQTDTRLIEFISLNATAHADEIAAPTEADLAAYHEDNAEIFTAPETRSAVYLHVSIDELAKTVEPSEEDLQDLYDARVDDYNLPETRALYQVIFDSEDAANAALAEIAAGSSSFDDIISARGESRADTSLGTVTAEEVVSAAGEAAFALTAPGVAGPVDTGFGFALVDVAAITPAEVTPLEDARDELLVDLRRDGARDLAPEIAGEIEDLRAGGKTLSEIASEMSLTLHNVSGIARDGTGAEGITASQEFLVDLFEAEEGEERDILETAEGGYFVLEQRGIVDSTIRPLEDVRGIVEAGWRAEALRQSLEAKADAAIERLNSGATLAEIASEFSLEIESEGPKSRIEGWTSLPNDLVQTLFDEGENATGRATAPGRIDTVVLAQVAAVAAAEDTEENQRLRDALAGRMNSTAGDDALTLFMIAKQEEFGVSVNQQALDAIFSQTGQGSGF